MSTPDKALSGPRGGAFAVLALTAASVAAAAAPDHQPLNRIQPYLMASRAREMALARTAAPPSVSAQATVLVLTASGYVTARSGRNGFVCLVARSWDNTLHVKRARFWDPTFRAPYCFNPAAAHSVLPRYLLRTRWVTAGTSRHQIGVRQQAARATGRLSAPQPGAMSYMMSRGGCGIGGRPGPWRPHLMFYFPRTQAPSWGANRPGNPVLSATHGEITVVYVLVPVWSDGSPAPALR